MALQNDPYADPEYRQMAQLGYEASECTNEHLCEYLGFEIFERPPPFPNPNNIPLIDYCNSRV